MQVFHFCSNAHVDAEEILSNGFQDSEGPIGKGVWFTDRIMENKRKTGPVLILDIPDDVFKQYETSQEYNLPWREAIIPAAVANQYEPPIVL